MSVCVQTCMSMWAEGGECSPEMWVLTEVGLRVDEAGEMGEPTCVGEGGRGEKRGGGRKRGREGRRGGRRGGRGERGERREGRRRKRKEGERVKNDQLL